MSKSAREVIFEQIKEQESHGVNQYCKQFRGKKVTLKDLLIFDGLYNSDKIKEEDFFYGEKKRSALILDFCNIIYASDWYKEFWEKVKGTGFRWYNWSNESEFFKNSDLIKEKATVDDIHKLLITIVRMEHWNHGFVYNVAKSGKIYAILERIKELKN